MADNTVVPIPGTTGDTIVTREVSHSGDTAKLPGSFLVGISGTEGAYTIGAIDGDATNGLDVDVTRLPALPAGDNNIGNVDVVTLPALPAGTNNIGDVDVLTLPALPTGTNSIGQVTANAGTNLNTSALALEAGGNLAAAATSLALLDNIVAGNEAQVDIVSSALPTGASTLAEQQSQTALLGTIDTDTGGIATSAASIDTKTPALGQALAAGSVPVVLTAAQLTTLTPPAAITGFATAANQTTEIGHLGTLVAKAPDFDTGAGADAVVSFGIMLPANGGAVVGGTSTNPIRTDPTGTTTQPVSAASLPLPTGASTLGEQQTQSTSLSSIATNTGNAATSLNVVDDWDESDRAKVNLIVGQAGVSANSGAVDAATQRVILASNDPAVTLLGTIDADTSSLAGCVGGTEVQVDIVAALPAGTNNIGDVDVLTLPALPAGTNNIGDVDILSIAAGNNNIGDVDIASIAAGDNNIGNVDIVTVPTDPFGANADAASATGSISAKLRGMATALGVTALDLGSGTGGSRTLRVFPDTAATYALAAGTNAIGKLAANSGVDIGDVDVTSIAAGTNLIGDVGLQPRTSGGLSIFRSIDLDETEEDVKTSAGQVYGIVAINLKSTPLYLKLYNATAANTTVGSTTPVMTIPIPSQGSTNGAGFVLNLPMGIAFSTAICAAVTTGVADADTGAPGNNEAVVQIFYK